MEACDDMDAARASITMAHAKLQTGLLYWCAEPTLRWTSLSRSSLDAYTVHIYYHCAVVQIHAGNLDAAIPLLDKACTPRPRLAEEITLEHARSSTRRGDIASLSDGTSRKAFEEAIKFADAEPLFFSARVRNNFGILWHSLGFDDQARFFFNTAANSADYVSAPSVETCNKLAESPLALRQLRMLGRDFTVKEKPVVNLDDAVVDLLKECCCGDIEIDIPEGSDKTQLFQSLERAERLKLSWRLRIKAHTNHLNILAASEQVSALEIVALMSEICADGRNCRTAVLFHPAYCALDADWITSGGKVRVATSIAAGLTELLRQNYFRDAAERARTAELTRLAFALVKSKVHGASSTDQGMYQYHYAKFMLLQGGDTDDVDSFIGQAILNHGSGVGHAPYTRLVAEALLLHGAAHPEMGPRLTLDIVRQALSIGKRRMQNADHPVLLRAASQLRGREAYPMHQEYAHETTILDLVESAIKLLS